MAKVLLGDVVDHVKDKVDKDTTDLEFYVGGEHIDSDEITVRRRGRVEGSTIGPAFHMRFQQGDVLLMSRNPHLRKASMVDFDGICSDVSYVCRTKDNKPDLQSAAGRHVLCKQDDLCSCAAGSRKNAQIVPHALRRKSSSRRKIATVPDRMR